MVQSKKFYYRDQVKWLEQRKGVLLSEGKPDIEIATPAEFKGHAGFWTPEDFLVASVNSCIMTTFLYFAEKLKIELVSYESHAEGVLERVDKEFMISEIKVTPKLKVKAENKEIVVDALEKSEKGCLISASVKSKVFLCPEITLV